MKSATDEVIFEVRDTGIGIPKDKIDGIFNKFYQIDSSYAKRFAGAGLGLTISKELVELMGGKIWVESEVGKSTSFYFSLEADIPEADMVALDQKGKMFTEPIKHKKSLRILLAEDDELSSQTMTYFLKKEGHTITHVVNGNEVLSALETDVFDIILMDVQMPEMDGVEATKQIRSCDTAKFDPKIPIIALTAYAMRGDKEKFLNAGMNDYATKPVDIDNLFEKMSQLVSAGRSFEAGVEDYSISSAEADDYIIEIQRFINNTRGAQEFLKEMLDEYSIRMNRLEKAILSKDTKEIELAIHKFIALFSAIFINSAIKISRDLLNAAKSNDLENCEHLFLDLKTKMQKIVNHIKNLRYLKMNNEYKILIIDDDLKPLRGHIRLLQSEGYSVETVETGEGGLTAAIETHPHLIILDVVLPDIDGVEVCRQLKSKPDYKAPYIVMLSAKMTCPDNFIKGFEAGADDYLAKPIVKEVLLARINAIFRMIKAEKALAEEKDKFYITLKSIGDGVIATDLNGKNRDDQRFCRNINRLVTGRSFWETD